MESSVRHALLMVNLLGKHEALQGGSGVAKTVSSSLFAIVSPKREYPAQLGLYSKKGAFRRTSFCGMSLRNAKLNKLKVSEDHKAYTYWANDGELENRI